MLDAGPAQPNQVDAPGTVSVEDLARGGDTRSAPPAECAASSITAAPGLQQLRSYDLRLLVSDRAAYFGRAHYRRAGNSYPLASRRLPLLWRWKSRRRAGRPSVAPEIRRLIREMSLANPLWGAPRIHGELLKLGIDVGQTSVAKYMAWRRRPPSQGWRTFLLNHADGIVSIDLFVVPTISFKLLYGLLILRHDRRQILWIGVTTSPTAEWIARQISEACGWEPVPDYLVRDRDRVYGEAFTRRIRAMGIRDRPTAPRSPWQNGYAERLIGSIRRECLVHVLVLGERHLRHVLRAYQQYYNGTRTHLALGKDSPLTRSVQAVGRILSLPVLGGLHHRYVRI